MKLDPITIKLGQYDNVSTLLSLIVGTYVFSPSRSTKNGKNIWFVLDKVGNRCFRILFKS